MKIKNTIQSVILAAVLFVLCSLPAHAGFGVSPTDISYEHLKPGASFEQTFTISRSESLEEMSVTIQPSLGEMSSWFKYDPGNIFTFGKGEKTKTFKVIVNIPSNAKYQDYSGVIRLTAIPTDQAVAGVSIAQGVRLDAQLAVTQEDFRSLEVQSIKALDSQTGKPIRIEITAKNTGNVDTSPTVKIKIMNLQMEVLEEHEVANFGYIKPNQTGTLIAEFTTSLPSGEYFIEVAIMLDGQELRKERLVFRITNTPSEDNSNQNTTTLVSSISNFFKNNTYFALLLMGAIILAVVAEIIIYKHLDKVWKKKMIRGISEEKPLSIVLGSKKSTRAIISFTLGFLIFLGVMFIPLVKDLNVSATDNGEAQDVQGVQDDNNASLNVLPESQLNYLIYTLPDTNSEIIYTAKDGEQFNVVGEVDGWYKVELMNGSLGWLQENIVKSKTIKGE